ncbi:hypothetical protein EM595_1236 [Duffyella gerundensis]|uniref:Uncharacterized protein n=1 Tax=Duffyella gerundensis TaxID=1619313 RepID=A0A0U5KZD7_9GAMM|nr:hypothetical protein EM595_1236 [Duffyella gerundensis]
MSILSGQNRLKSQCAFLWKCKSEQKAITDSYS